MANTRFFLDQRKTKDGQAVLKLVIAHQRSSALISLAKIVPEQWNAENEEIEDHPESASLNALIKYKKGVVDRVIMMLELEGSIKTMTAAEVRSRCMDELEPEHKAKKERIAQEKVSFIYRFKRYADRMKPGSKRTYDHTVNRLEAFCATPDQMPLERLKFEDITLDWLHKFDTFMAENGSSKNTRNIHYRNMRAVFNEAIDDGITTAYPFRRFKIKNEITPERCITVEELRQLIFFDCEEHAKKYRDYFILMFLLMGINNVDLCNVKEIVNGRLIFHRTKTNHYFSMKVEPEAMKLIEQYKGKGQLLDILDHWDDDVYFRKKMNKTLQKIGPVKRSGLGGKKEYAPLFPKLTTYYARHTWASIADDLEIPQGTISEGLGHEYGNKVTRGYIHKYSYKNIDKANRKVIDWVFYGKIDGNVVVEPGTPEFFGLDKKKAQKLGLLKKVAEKEKSGNPTEDATKEPITQQSESEPAKKIKATKKKKAA